MPTYKDEKTGKWYVKCRYTDYSGKRRQKLKRGFTLQRDAKEWEREFLKSQSGSPDMPFSAMCEIYLADKKKHTKAITYRTKKNRIDAWLFPYFGDKPLNSITAADVRQWQGELKEATGATGRPLSAGYLQNLVTELSGIFNFAMKFYGLNKNPVRIAGNIVGKKGKSVNFWTKEEFDRFILTFEKSDPFYTAFLTLYYTGLRLGELQALTVGDVDFKTGCIHINKTYNVIDGKETVTTPKTEKSNRDILIPPFLCDVLEKYISRYYGLCKNDRIFYMGRSRYAISLKKHAELACVKSIRIHDLRHSHASLLIELGFSALLVSERLGHESVSTTLDIYSHLFPSKQSEVVERLARLCEDNHY